MGTGGGAEGMREGSGTRMGAGWKGAREGRRMVGGRGGTNLDETRHLLLHDGGRVVLHGRGTGAGGDKDGMGMVWGGGRVRPG